MQPDFRNKAAGAQNKAAGVQKQNIMYRIIDTHAHYDNEEFDHDREILLGSFPEKGIEKVINAGASVRGALRGLEMAEKWPHVYCALGVHPNDIFAASAPVFDEEPESEDSGTAGGEDDASGGAGAPGPVWRHSQKEDLTEDVLRRFAELSSHPKVVAIGEIGLEYHYEEPDREVQKHWFRRQIALAKEVGLPIIVHSRDAVQDTLNVIREEHAEDAGGVIHCFSAGPEVAAIYVKLGFYIGVGGVVTFKNGRKMKEVVQSVPMERILLETDSPYLAPVPHRGHRNCSLYLPQVAEAIAELKGLTRDEVIEITRENALRCFPRLK